MEIEGAENCECGTPSGDGTWSFSSNARGMLPGVEERVWEQAMALAGEVMGPWWLLRVLEPASAQALPKPVRACAGRDAVWFNICRVEGLVTRDLRPRVPFDAAVLEGGLEWWDVGGDLDRGLLDRGLLDRSLLDRGLFLHHSRTPDSPDWIHIYLQSKKAKATVKNVVGTVPTTLL